jgi:ABC-type Fe3+-hydroxamate transport system substrate-binding protein
MPIYTDQLKRHVILQSAPQRIVSLVPSQTELLFSLGLNETVVGITKFCVHPNEWFRTKTRVGGTKQVNMAAIQRLYPDLIIANKEENVKEQIESLSEKYPVWISDIKNLQEALQMIQCIGVITGKEKEANTLYQEITLNFRELVPLATRSRTAYLIWQNPYITVGGDTFINTLMHYCGFENVFANHYRYPETNVQQLKEMNPELVLLSSEPYLFKEKHVAQLKQHLPNSHIMLIDGELFSWYGSRLLKAPAYFTTLINELNLKFN